MLLSLLVSFAVNATDMLKFHCVDLSHRQPVKSVFIYQTEASTYIAKTESKDDSQILSFNDLNRQIENQSTYVFANNDFRIQFAKTNDAFSRPAELAIKSQSINANSWVCKPYQAQ